MVPVCVPRCSLSGISPVSVGIITSPPSAAFANVIGRSICSTSLQGTYSGRWRPSTKISMPALRSARSPLRSKVRTSPSWRVTRPPGAMDAYRTTLGLVIAVKVIVFGAFGLRLKAGFWNRTAIALAVDPEVVAPLATPFEN